MILHNNTQFYIKKLGQRKSYIVPIQYIVIIFGDSE